MSRLEVLEMRRELIAVLGVAALMLVGGCGGSGQEQPAGPTGTQATAGGEATPGSGATTTMTTGQGKTHTLTMQTLPGSRGYEYCELVFNYGDNKGSDLYSTSPLAPCSETWWNGLDLKALAAEFGAESVTKNGPQWWSMDEVAVMASEPVPVAGVDMVLVSHLPPGTMGTAPYQVFSPSKTQNLTWKAGQPTYRLTDTDGNVYVVQGYKVAKDSLATLGSQFKELPEGWKYTVVNPTEDLVMNLSPNAPIPSVQDEFDQIYIRITQS